MAARRVTLAEIADAAKTIPRRTYDWLEEAVRKAPENYRNLQGILRSVSQNSKRNYNDTLRR
jgi:hypothetical protein